MYRFHPITLNVCETLRRSTHTHTISFASDFFFLRTNGIGAHFPCSKIKIKLNIKVKYGKNFNEKLLEFNLNECIYLLRMQLYDSASSKNSSFSRCWHYMIAICNTMHGKILALRARIFHHFPKQFPFISPPIFFLLLSCGLFHSSFFSHHLFQLLPLVAHGLLIL